MIQDKRNNDLLNWEIVSINPNQKKWKWGDLFFFWAVSVQSVIGFSLIASLYLVYDLNFYVVLFGGIFASILTCIFSTLIGKPSQKHGLPFVVILRSSLGILGAKYFGLLRGFVGIFMFGVQTFFISKAIGYLIRIFLYSQQGNMLDSNIFTIFFMGLDIIDTISFLFTLLLQFFLFSKGQSTIKSIIKFSGIFVYFGLTICLIMIAENFNVVLKSASLTLNFENFLSKNNVFPLMTVTGTLFAFFSILVVNFGDYSRYVQSNDDLIKGNLSLIINFILLSIFAIFIVLGADIILAKNNVEIDRLLTNPNDIIGKINNTFLTTTILIFILVASVSTNLIANYIPSQNIIINFLPKSVNLKSSGIIIIIFSFIVGVLWLPFFSQIGILSIIDTLGSFFGPIFGVIIADYFLIKDKKIENKDIYSTRSEGSYFYSRGWHITGLYSIIIGFIFASSTIWNINLNFLQSFSWIIGAIISFIVYYLLKSK